MSHGSDSDRKIYANRDRVTVIDLKNIDKIEID
jgi:hypothetical protein